MTIPRRMRSDALPPVVPVFAISGAILLPGGTMPLMVFEPRYLALTDDALGAGRLFALIQPREEQDGVAPGLHDVGCLGRITAFGETVRHSEGQMIDLSSKIDDLAATIGNKVAAIGNTLAGSHPSSSPSARTA